MKSSCQAECGQATLRQLRKCLRLCLQLPLMWQDHPKALNPAECLLYFDNWDFPGIPLPICLCGLHPFRQCFGCSMCDLSPLRCMITFYWIECKIEAKAYSLCNMSNFFRSCYSAEPMLKHFQQPINFWCQLLVPNPILIFTRIWNKLEPKIKKLRVEQLKKRYNIFPIFKIVQEKGWGETCLPSEMLWSLPF